MQAGASKIVGLWQKRSSHMTLRMHYTETSLGLPVALPLRFHLLLGIMIIYKASELHLNPLYECQRVGCDVLQVQGNSILFKISS